jgi:quercetin dioxygenase-like cupin family protein
MPFTFRNLRGDLDDLGSNFDDDEVIELRRLDAVRVPPGSWRGYEAGPEGLELLVVGAPNLGDDPRGDVEGTRDWWPR